MTCLSARKSTRPHRRVATAYFDKIEHWRKRAAPSPRSPSGRVRSSPSKTGVNALSSATGYGEGRGVRGPFHKLELAERPPHPPPPFPPASGERGRRAALISSECALAAKSRRINARNITSADDLVAGEELADFLGCGCGGVGTMH